MFRTALRAVAAYLVVLAALCVGVRWLVSLHEPLHRDVVASVWKEGALIDRVIYREGQRRDARLDRVLGGGGELVLETVVGESPIFAWPDVVLGISLVPGRDGIKATLGERTAYVTPDDLLSRQLYDHGLRVASIGVTLGLDTGPLAILLADKLKATRETVFEQASLRRIRVERKSAIERPRITAANLRREDVREAVVAGAKYLARGISPEGRFRYTVSAPGNKDLPGYDWPRHAGATFFVAQVAAMTNDPILIEAARRAASLMTASGLSSCAGLPCVGEEERIGLGSSALAVVALSEIVEKKIDESFAPAVVGLARFLRAQQRPDGEFMHYFDRSTGLPIDYQGLYYSSEAALALAKAYGISKDPADLDAAVRALQHLVGPAWSFFGDRYYFSEEHWTCQALGALWPHAPNPKALDFCLRWQAFGRALQQRDGDSPFDADGAIGVGPVITPRLTPVASRCEAAVATLDVARRAGVAGEEIALLDEQLRRALALLLRQQLLPGPRHLFKSPEAVEGAMPGSQVDWELRIDYTQHTGSALVRWLDLAEATERARAGQP
ncbi:MAG TPA: hypothetical protein VK540_06390 [Polyangiaceae bacterium]|nr:hypothetical protein [Polyangiaceae bacterium]